MKIKRKYKCKKCRDTGLVVKRHRVYNSISPGKLGNPNWYVGETSKMCPKCQTP
jgi:hypothetical protein